MHWGKLLYTAGNYCLFCAVSYTILYLNDNQGVKYKGAFIIRLLGIPILKITEKNYKASKQ